MTAIGRTLEAVDPFLMSFNGQPTDGRAVVRDIFIIRLLDALLIIVCHICLIIDRYYRYLK